MKKLLLGAFAALIMLSANAQKTIYEPTDYQNLKFSFDDFGSMWTFDAVQFAGGCSGAFVSEDGLIMTNHHCVRSNLWKVKQKGEDIHRDGFYAEKLEEERPFPGLYVDQLIAIDNVTNDIVEAMQTGKTNEEKVELKQAKIKELVAAKEKVTGLTCRVVTLYNGGKYSLYSYKRYSDIRLVMVPDVQIAATGWDWDNFTYPRYELDFAFVRAYDEKGKPVKVENFYTWSPQGAQEGEPIFVIGRPGNTDRLLSVRQLNHFKNLTHPLILTRLNEAYQAYFQFFQKHPNRQADLLGQLLSVANGRKYYAGLVMALNDKYIMTKKQDFENQLRSKVKQNPDLNKKYGHIWNDIDAAIDAAEKQTTEYYIYRLANYYGNDYWQTASNMVQYAKQMQLPQEKRSEKYKPVNLEKTKAAIFVTSPDKDLQELLVQSYASFLMKAVGAECRIAQKLFDTQTGKQASDFFLANTQVDNKQWVNDLIKEPQKILQSKDPLIQVIKDVAERSKIIQAEQDKMNNALEVLNQELGRVIYEVYGQQIPPDATSTLRISHGVIAGYEYNGTLAPAKSLYYGLYDRYHAFGGNDYPWGLHPRWKNPPTELDLKIPMCFASTNDIVGGNSGSSIINTKGEVIGLVHDGNLESLAGGYIFLPENNRTVATDSHGLMEALKLVYKTERLVYELQNSKLK